MSKEAQPVAEFPTKIYCNRSGRVTMEQKTKRLIIICACALLCVLIIVAGLVIMFLLVNRESIPVLNQLVQTDSDVSIESSIDSSIDSAYNNESMVPHETNSQSDRDEAIGFRNVKADSAEIQTEEQSLIAQYFDNDYLDVNSYEMFARYPTIFEGAQVNFYGKVEKIISSDDSEYVMLVWVGKNELSFYYRGGNGGEMYEDYRERTKNNLVIIKGPQTESRLMVGDDIAVYGRYNNIETHIIDGVSYTIPSINAYRTYFCDGWSSPVKYDSDFIKQVAKALFGNDIEVRNAVMGEDYPEEPPYSTYFEDHPFMICELENQTNSRFTKYRLSMQSGIVEDAKSQSHLGYSDTDDPIIRQIEFAADYQHYFIYTFDKSLNSMSVAYYDRNLNKLWQREFEETTNGAYDYTEKCFYIVANNDLYIIDVATGEDIITPRFVGEKSDIRKISDGIIMLSMEQTDTIMKTDLEGNVIWKTNIMDNNVQAGVINIQFVDDRIILSIMGTNYYELNATSGEIITKGERLTTN